jgi:hypothetical protein
LFVCARSHFQNSRTQPAHAIVFAPYSQPVAGCAEGEPQNEHVTA